MVQVYSVSSSSRTVHMYSLSRFLTLPLISRLNIFSARDRQSASGTRTINSSNVTLTKLSGRPGETRQAKSRSCLSDALVGDECFILLSRTGSFSAHPRSGLSRCGYEQTVAARLLTIHRLIFEQVGGLNVAD